MRQKYSAAYGTAKRLHCKLSISQSRSKHKQKKRKKGRLTGQDGGLKPSAYYKLLAAMQGNILALDKQIQAKQKMIFDIEKECAMTISSATRSIPKKPEQEKNPLLAALEGAE